MTAAGWAALGTGGAALALAVTAIVLAVKLAGKAKQVADLVIALASARYEVGKLSSERDLVVGELDDMRRRTGRQLAELRRDVETCESKYLEQASDAELREAFKDALGRFS